MQVRTGGQLPCVAEQTDCFPTRNKVALLFEQRGAVFVDGNAFATVLDEKGVARFDGVGTEQDRPVVHRLNGRACLRDQIHPQMPNSSVQTVGNPTHNGRVGEPVMAFVLPALRRCKANRSSCSTVSRRVISLGPG